MSDVAKGIKDQLDTLPSEELLWFCRTLVCQCPTSFSPDFQPMDPSELSWKVLCFETEEDAVLFNIDYTRESVSRGILDPMKTCVAHKHCLRELTYCTKEPVMGIMILRERYRFGNFIAWSNTEKKPCLELVEYGRRENSRPEGDGGPQSSG